MNELITSTTTALNGELDPTKHVNFTFGMVLGEDDFNQEFAYHSGRNQWLGRDAIGYGTLRGLRVKVDRDPLQPGIAVEPGVAISPRGQLMCVSPEQCAQINTWLTDQGKDAKKQTALKEHIFKAKGAGGAEVNKLRLFVTLQYQACLTDNVPIPGEPCRSEDMAMAASRQHDDFQLELRYAPPEQLEEDSLRDFVDWLTALPVDPAALTTPEQFAKTLAETFQTASVTEVTDLLFAPTDLKIPAGQARQFYRNALYFWDAQVRSSALGFQRFSVLIHRTVNALAARTEGTVVTPDGFKALVVQAAHLTDEMVTSGFLDETAFANARIEGNPPSFAAYHQAALAVWRESIEKRWLIARDSCALRPVEERLLLAEVLMELKDDLTAVAINAAGDQALITLNEANRPYLMHLRMLQEWLLADIRNPSSGGGPTPGTTVAKEVGWNQPEVVGTSSAYARADHSHGTPQNPIPDHTQDVNAHNKHNIQGDVTGSLEASKVAKLQGKSVSATPPQPGQVLTFVQGAGPNLGEWQPANPSAGGSAVHTHNLLGDVTGSMAATTISAIQGTKVNAASPTNGQVLTVEGNQWVARAPIAGGGNFVERPTAPTLKQFQIVAAGVVGHSPVAQVSPNAPTAGELKVTGVQDGIVTIHFVDYKRPDPTHQYVIKALPVFNGNVQAKLKEMGLVVNEPVVAFFDFLENDEGFMLSVTDQGKFLDAGALKGMEFMIEVSQFSRPG